MLSLLIHALCPVPAEHHWPVVCAPCQVPDESHQPVALAHWLPAAMACCPVGTCCPACQLAFAAASPCPMPHFPSLLCPSLQCLPWLSVYCQVLGGQCWSFFQVLPTLLRQLSAPIMAPNPSAILLPWLSSEFVKAAAATRVRFGGGNSRYVETQSMKCMGSTSHAEPVHMRGRTYAADEHRMIPCPSFSPLH